MRRICYDLDGTLCTDEGGKYALARPIPERVEEVRRRYDAGEYIIIDTARGSTSRHDWREATHIQLTQWGVPYHELRTGLKPAADLYVDDRGIHPDDFFPGGHADRWPDEYFSGRVLNDERRLKSVDAEAEFLTDHKVWFNGPVCDVGCSTGELLVFLKWSGPRYGMEISAHARRIAESNGIRFDRNILTETNYFDTVIFRGTIQHLPHPFRYIERAYKALKPGGHVAFLATPNTGSLVYRLFQELPVSDDVRNYWMPSAKTLTNALRNFGFEIVATEYPYLNGGYARPMRDTLSFARRLLLGGKTNFPWPGSMMNVLARRP